MRIVAIVAVAMLAAGCAAPSTPVPSGPLTAIPDQMRLTHHGEPGWTRSHDAGAPGVFQPCPDQPDPTLVGRIDAITAVGPLRPVEGSTTATLHEQLLLFATDDAASTAMIALIKAKEACGGWSIEMADGVGDYDSDVFGTSRSDPPDVPFFESTAREHGGVLHRGPALWIHFQEERGPYGPGFHHGRVDVRAEMCQLMALCYRGH
jgi:hypothetical protein